MPPVPPRHAAAVGEGVRGHVSRLVRRGHLEEGEGRKVIIPHEAVAVDDLDRLFHLPVLELVVHDRAEGAEGRVWRSQAGMVGEVERFAGGG